MRQAEESHPLGLHTLSMWEHPKPVHLGMMNAVFGLLLLYSIGTSNPFETIWSIAILWITIRLFWWQGFPPIMAYTMIMPWLEVHFNVFEANFYGIDFNNLFPSGTGKQTFWIASTGYLAVLAGLKVGLKSIRHRLVPTQEAIILEATKLNQFRIVIGIFAFRMLEAVLAQAIPWGNSLRQIVTYSSGIGLTLSCLFALHFFITKRRPLLFFGVFLFELITSFYSYFGSWKGPIVILFLGAATTIKKVKPKQLLVFSPLIIGVFCLTFIWQTIKPEYRAFLSQGERSQSVFVSQKDALNEVLDLSSKALQMDEAKRQVIFSGIFRRIGYLEYFSDAVRKVPAEIEHEHGNLLLENIKFALVPRLINPSKGTKNDRLKVEKYTDYHFGENSFSSFSLGHYCEAYIDWGWAGSLIQLFMHGLLGAWLLKVVYHRFQHMNQIMILAILYCVMHVWGTMQQDFITMIGRATWNTICQLLIFFPLYKWLSSYLTSNSTAPMVNPT